MEEQVERLVQKAWDKFGEVPQSKRLMIAVSGIPGSGAQRPMSDILSRAHTENRQDDTSCQSCLKT